MNKYEWIEKITENCKSVGTYQPAFDTVIDTLATILESRDEIERMYQEDGGRPMIIGEGYNGQETRKKNPLLQCYEDMNKDALSYWRDLGLTPSGLKKIKENSLKGDDDGFNDLLDKVEARIKEQHKK